LHVRKRPDQSRPDHHHQSAVAPLQARLPGYHHDTGESNEQPQGATPTQAVLKEKGGQNCRKGHLKLHRNRGSGSIDVRQPIVHQGEVQRAKREGEQEDLPPAPVRQADEGQQYQSNESEAQGQHHEWRHLQPARLGNREVEAPDAHHERENAPVAKRDRPHGSLTCASRSRFSSSSSQRSSAAASSSCKASRTSPALVKPSGSRL